MPHPRSYALFIHNPIGSSECGYYLEVTFYYELKVIFSVEREFDSTIPMVPDTAEPTNIPIQSLFGDWTQSTIHQVKNVK